MTAKEYLSQAYRLDQKINSHIEELSRLRSMSQSISSPGWGDKVQSNRNTEAPYVRCLEKIIALEDTINAEIDILVDLKQEIRTVIEAVANTDWRMVLRYRYIHNCTWEQIGAELNADSRTIRRWHSEALKKVVVPENPIQISKVARNVRLCP